MKTFILTAKIDAESDLSSEDILKCFEEQFVTDGILFDVNDSDAIIYDISINEALI